MEKESRKRAKRENIQKIVLATISTMGMVGLVLLAPNVLGAMGKLGIISQKRHRDSINRARDRLIQKGLLVREKGMLRVTPRGETTLRRMELSAQNNLKRRRWDGKWRVLIFDVPEYRRSVREKIRRTLAAVGFMRLQDSVWVYPHDCEDFVALLKADFHIGKDMLYMIVEQLENDERLKGEFGISN